MLRKILLIAVASLFIFGISKMSFAMMCAEHGEQKQMSQTHTEHEQGATETTKQTAAERTVNVGNKICPVSGEKIEEKTKTTYAYAGKIYNFCCASCIDDFKKDPEKYIKKVEEELQAKPLGQAGVEKEALPESGMPSAMHEGHQH